MEIKALSVEKQGKLLRVKNTNGLDFVSNDASEILKTIAQSGDGFNVVWDSNEFWKPLLTLLPKDKAASLVDGKAVYYDGIRLWWGITRHGRGTGIRYKTQEHIIGNIYQPISQEIEISELRQYYDEQPKDLEETKQLGERLIATLKRMGLNPTSLISAAGIYKECILDKLEIPCLFSMPESSWDCHEMAYKTVDEWVANYKSRDDTGVYSYDLTGAYASALAELPNLNYADIVYSQEIPPPGWYWGVMQGMVYNKTIISPLHRQDIYRGYVGYWEDVITSDLFGSLYSHDIAEFKIKDGWFIYLDRNYKPFEYVMKQLYAHRNGDKLENNLAKAMAVSTWGKMLETRGEDYGDLFNAIYGSMVVNKIKAKVLDFIYSNKLQDFLVSVNVDGVKATKKLDITTERRFGEWRLNNG